MYPIDEMLFSGQYRNTFVRMGIARYGDTEYLRRIVIGRNGDILHDWTHQRYRLDPDAVPPKNLIVRFIVDTFDRYLRRRDQTVYQDFMNEIEELRKL